MNNNHDDQPPLFLWCLSVSLGHTLDLILLLDGIGVTTTTCSIDDLISQTLGDGLDVTEGGLTCTSGEKVEGLFVERGGGTINKQVVATWSTSEWVMSEVVVVVVINPLFTWFTRRNGDISTAWRRTTPAEPTRVESSRGPALMMASTNTFK